MTNIDNHKKYDIMKLTYGGFIMLELENIEGIGPKTKELLEKLRIFTVEDLIKKTEDDMLKVKNLGRKSLDEVIHKLESLGLGLKTNED